MRRSIHIAVQAGLVVAQYIPHVWPIIPAAGLEPWHAMISTLQGVLAAAAHSWNVDGSAAK